MSIRPIDMQVMVPKLQEISRLNHLDQQKGNVNQHQIANTLSKENQKKQRSVAKSHGEENLKNNADAKDKGHNQYYSDGKRQNKPKKENTSRFSRHKIDIKI